MNLVVIGADSVNQVQELVTAARDFQPLSPQAQHQLEKAVAPFARGLMYYKP